MKIIVLGSGVIGVSTAWWLCQAGHEIHVIDRASGPAQETSRANGGQISVGHSEPWANSHAPLNILKWLGKADAPLLFRPELSLLQWHWGLAFLRECFPSRLRPNIRAMIALAQYSRDTLIQMRYQLGLQYNHTTQGILTFYRDVAQFEASQNAADHMRDFGVERRVISKDEIAKIEPSLAPSLDSIVGGDYTATDETGDAYLYTKELAKLSEQSGVTFYFNTQATRILERGGHASGVEVIDPTGSYASIAADAVVVAAGSYSGQLFKPLGIHCLLYPIKGYSATFPILKPAAAPMGSLTDAGHQVAITRLGQSLRVAGTAEISGYSNHLNPVRCQLLSDLARQLFPDILAFDDVQYWTGLRPSTPSNVPLVGRTRISNLYLNTGHGTLGWTMAAGTGRAIADLIDGKKPEPDFPFIGITR